MVERALASGRRGEALRETATIQRAKASPYLLKLSPCFHLRQQNYLAQYINYQCIMAAAKKMDELLVSWLSNDATYESIMDMINTFQATVSDHCATEQLDSCSDIDDGSSHASPRGIIPPFYPATTTNGSLAVSDRRFRRKTDSLGQLQQASWDGSVAAMIPAPVAMDAASSQRTLSEEAAAASAAAETISVRDLVQSIFQEVGVDATAAAEEQGMSNSMEDSMSISRKYLLPEQFVRITKDVCRFPSFFNGPLYQRILDLWNAMSCTPNEPAPMKYITFEMLEWFYKSEMEPFDMVDRFFRLVKQPQHNFIERNDFLPFIKALLSDHPGLEFLSNHAEFQEKYAVTVITRIFYSVNTCHSGRMTCRQVRRSDLLQAFYQVDEEEDINKVTRYLSYEHFYVLYCRFWELDHDRDYRITKDDLLKYGDHSLSHMVVDRIFDAAPRPFEADSASREFLTYESFIYFMLSEEDKSNEVSVRYWFHCVDVDGDGKLNNMEMRSFYAVQLHRMQCMGHEIVPFEDMLCQMMDMIKPANPDYFIVEDFLQPECCQVSGALFDALFNLNKYLLFEQRDPFVERQKREDEFDCDWDRFACIDYNRLAMEEEAREEEAMEIDWVTVDEDGDAAAAAAGGQIAGVATP
ncbi:hypothetical protein MPSEU_000593700 [Mayamaea pseudoterrestris]|nr:hypothetical protein MPSEU_000593700 [Mayamaea pseudoterrestris]